MHERRFEGNVERLRNPHRVALLEVERVVDSVLAGLSEINSLLDVGTGSGLFAEQFAARGLSVTGLDVNPVMLSEARKFVPNGTFEEGVAERLPFKDGSFDVIFMGLVLHETDYLQKVFDEAYRVVKKRLAILEWPYRVQDFGPPLEHRLSFEHISFAADQSGFIPINKVELENLVLYLYKK